MAPDALAAGLAARAQRAAVRAGALPSLAAEPDQDRGRLRPDDAVLLHLWFLLRGAGAEHCDALLAPPAVVAFLVIWALPDLNWAPTRSLEWLFLPVLIALIGWPDYLAIELPGLPWITLTAPDQFSHGAGPSDLHLHVGRFSRRIDAIAAFHSGHSDPAGNLCCNPTGIDWIFQ